MSAILLVSPASQSVEELSLNGVSIPNSTGLPDAFDDHSFTIGPKLACKSEFQIHLFIIYLFI